MYHGTLFLKYNCGETIIQCRKKNKLPTILKSNNILLILVYYTLQMQSQTSLTYSQNSYQSQDVRFEQGMAKMYTLSMYYWGPPWS